MKKSILCATGCAAQCDRREDINVPILVFHGRRRVVKVLKLSAQGLPQSWITLEQAVTHYAAGEVRWEIGAQVALFRGGHNAITGEQSQIAVSSIIGTRGVPNINPFDLYPSL